MRSAGKGDGMCPVTVRMSCVRELDDTVGGIG